MKVRMDSLAAFFEMELIVEDGASIRAGDLFDSYKDFCEEIKKPAMSLTTFSPGLEKLCTELHLPVVRDRSSRHVTFVGLRLRGKNDYHPTYSQQLAALCRTSDSTSSTSAGLGAGLLPIQDIGLQDLQDFPSNILGNCENTEKTESAVQKNQEKLEVKEVTPPSPASPANPLLSKALSPAPSPANPPISPASIEAKHKEFKLGDRVVIVDRGLHHEQKGKVIELWWSNIETEYVIELDQESHLHKVVTITVPHRSGFPVLMKM